MAEPCPVEWQRNIEQGLAAGTIYGRIFTQEDLDEAIQQGVDGCLAKLREQMEWESLNDLHRRMSWWASFGAQHPPPWEALKKQP